MEKLAKVKADKLNYAMPNKLKKGSCWFHFPQGHSGESSVWIQLNEHWKETHGIYRIIKKWQMVK